MAPCSCSCSGILPYGTAIRSNCHGQQSELISPQHWALLLVFRVSRTQLAGVPYLALTVAGHLNDMAYAALEARSSNNRGRPEYRVPMMAIGSILVPVGLLWWGGSGEKHLHWIMPSIGCVIFTSGVYICSSCVSVYIINAYMTFAASAKSTNLVLRSCFTAFFPNFAPYMFVDLGFGWSATILAGSFLIVGITTMLVLWFWGRDIRERSLYCAAGDAE
jgi:hypothetical protein